MFFKKKHKEPRIMITFQLWTNYYETFEVNADRNGKMYIVHQGTMFPYCSVMKVVMYHGSVINCEEFLV